MRALKAISVAALLIMSGSPAFVQNLSQAEPPAEIPPESYLGTQYVDSKGCVYVRAGMDGATVWVPRVTRSRELLCGFKPTFAAAAEDPAEMPAAPGPEQAATDAATAAGDPEAEVATVTPEAPAEATDMPATSATAQVPSTTAAGPARPATARPAAQPAPQPAARGFVRRTLPRGTQVRLEGGEVLVVASPTTVRVPMVDGLTPDEVVARATIDIAAPPSARYVQVGVFADAANAQQASRALHELGLTVSRARLTRGQAVHDVVLAGPYATTDALEAAMEKIRARGFSDAFYRR